MDRIVGAFTFRRGVYAEVEHDQSFTRTAWSIVVVVVILSQLGSVTSGGLEHPFGSLIALVLRTLIGVASFAIAVWVVSVVGRSVFKAEVTFDELVRTLGLAYVWRAVGVLGLLGALGLAFACIVAPIRIIASLAALAGWLVASKEALDLEWLQVIITVVLAWIALIAIAFLAGLALASLGFGADDAAGLFG